MAKKKQLTEQQKAEKRKRNTESKRKSRARDAAIKKKNDIALEKQRKAYRTEEIEKSNDIWDKYLKDFYGK